jgi:hypothetical protein
VPGHARSVIKTIGDRKMPLGEHWITLLESMAAAPVAAAPEPSPAGADID